MYSFRFTYRNPIMRALGLNIERNWLRLLVASGWLALAALGGFVFIGLLLLDVLGLKIEPMLLFLLSCVPMIALGVVYAVDSVRQAPEFR